MTLHFSETIDLDAYFQRIGYTGDRAPTLQTLRAIHCKHPQVIPFENLTPLLKQPVQLDLKSLQHKLIQEKRGGYCFEQNLLLRSVLLALGFQVINLAARVLWNRPEGAIAPRSHMLLQIELEGEQYLVDVGFGGLTLTAPLLLQPDIEQQTPHEVFRLLWAADSYLLQAKLGQEWKPLYRFDLQEQQLPDYEVSNWYVSTHPNSPFVNSLMVARPDSECRFALQNNQLTTYYLDGGIKQRVLKTADDFCTVLETIFRLQLPTSIDFDHAFQRFIQ